MKQTIYNFQPIKNQLQNDRKGQIVNTRDYFEFYHTGIELLPYQKGKDYFQTTRVELERSEVIAYDFYDEEDLSDLVLALNNDVYLWDGVTTFDMKRLVAMNKFNMYKENMFRGDYENDVAKDWIENNKMKLINRFIAEMEIQDDIQKEIIVPKFQNLQRVIRNIRKYLDNRKVY